MPNIESRQAQQMMSFLPFTLVCAVYVEGKPPKDELRHAKSIMKICFLARAVLCRF